MIKHFSDGITNKCDWSLPLGVLNNLSNIVAAPEPRNLVIDVLELKSYKSHVRFVDICVLIFYYLLALLGYFVELLHILAWEVFCCQLL